MPPSSPLFSLGLGPVSANPLLRNTTVVAGAAITAAPQPRRQVTDSDHASRQAASLAVGFDDIPLGHLLRPHLTTVRRPIQQLGATAFELLKSLITAGRVARREVVLPVQLIRRGSCGCPAASLRGRLPCHIHCRRRAVDRARLPGWEGAGRRAIDVSRRALAKAASRS